jgi:hypothetical protein
MEGRTAESCVDWKYKMRGDLSVNSTGTQRYLAEADHCSGYNTLVLGVRMMAYIR